MRGIRTLAYAATVGGAGYRLLASGQLTLDTGVGRTLRPLGPITVAMAAPRDTVFDVIAAPYLGRTPRAMADRLEYTGELGADFWELGRWWADQVATKWEATVHTSLDRIRTEAERRAS